MTPARLRAAAILFAAAPLLWGCASHRRVTSRQPAPTPPATTPESAGESAKSETSVPPSPSRPRRSKTPPTPAPVGFTEEGNASWYGKPFDGRRASNGEVYDMHKLTAAHRTLPFDTMVRVTNLNNGKSTTVRITDRGPFVANRIIDLSLAAAQEIESIGPGVVPVRLQVLGNVDVNAGFFTVQVGAFKDPANANRLRDRLSQSYSPVFVQQFAAAEGTFYRVRVGKISGEEATQEFANKLRDTEGFTPFVVRLDEK